LARVRGIEAWREELVTVVIYFLFLAVVSFLAVMAYC
jgi:hypothetical protein